jgi:iron complex transport system ATP-binding protein
MIREALLVVQDLTVGYGSHILFEKLALELCQEELVCFMGPNGAGKSTLIRTIGGLQKPISGHVTISAHREKNHDEFSKKIALVLTDQVRDVNMTVFEMVSFGRYPYLNWDIRLSRGDEDIILQAIRQVNIEHLKDQKVHQLSDGQLQMTMIARALAQDTPIIILDEPTAHLDLNNRVEIMKLLRHLAKAMKKAILLATHELDLALQTADLIWLTDKSKNIITGIPEDLVLNGAFDQTFLFKGFDLKTGKVQHEIFQKLQIHLSGNGYPYLWTKNALERNGFHIAEKKQGVGVEVISEGHILLWRTSEGHNFASIKDLLAHLCQLSA